MAKLWRLFRSVAIGFVLLLVLFYFSPIVPAVANWLTGDWQDARGDVLIVLGADQLGDGTLGVVSYWRSVYAVRAFRTGGFERVVVSGGALGDLHSISIARAMGEFMIALGIPASAVTLEEKSMSTRENALFTTALVRDWPGRKVLLTSDCHMRRAHAAFARAGLATVPAPIPDVGKRWNSWVDRWACIWAVGLQAAKYGYYEVRGWI